VLTPIPPSRVLHEWDAISADLARAFKRDPARNWLDILGQALSGDLHFWRVRDFGSGYLVTQVTREPGTLRRVWWVIYVGGTGGTMDDKRALMEIIEAKARDAKCSECRFEGRDWRKIFPDYAANKGADGRWHFRKALS